MNRLSSLAISADYGPVCFIYAHMRRLGGEFDLHDRFIFCDFVRRDYRTPISLHGNGNDASGNDKKDLTG